MTEEEIRAEASAKLERNMPELRRKARIAEMNFRLFKMEQAQRLEMLQRKLNK